MPVPRTLVTRPESEAAPWVAALQARGLRAQALPLIAIAAPTDAAAQQALHTARQHIARYAAMFPELAQQLAVANRDEPYRQFLALARERLRATRDGGEHAYQRAAELIADLALVRDGLLTQNAELLTRLTNTPTEAG